jgi:hypothetical protein
MYPFLDRPRAIFPFAHVLCPCWATWRFTMGPRVLFWTLHMPYLTCSRHTELFRHRTTNDRIIPQISYNQISP